MSKASYQWTWSDVLLIFSPAIVLTVLGLVAAALG